jgi:hypothetical protein
MRGIVYAGVFGIALGLGACAAKQPPAPPPLKIVTEVEPKAEPSPAPPTQQQIVAAFLAVTTIKRRDFGSKRSLTCAWYA